MRTENHLGAFEVGGWDIAIMWKKIKRVQLPQGWWSRGADQLEGQAPTSTDRRTTRWRPARTGSHNVRLDAHILVGTPVLAK